MHDILAACLDDLYADPHGSQAATIFPVAGSSVTVQALVFPQERPSFEVFGAGSQRAGTVIEFRQGEYPTEPTPWMDGQPGDVITVDTRIFHVKLARVDIWRKRWTVDCDEMRVLFTPSMDQVAQLPSFLVGQY